MDDIPDVSYVRNQLAVIPKFKNEIGFVQEWEVAPGTMIQEGTVGAQEMDGVVYPGGGSQVQILNPGDKALMVPVGSPRQIK